MSGKQLVLGDGAAYDLPVGTDVDRLRADLERCMVEGRTPEVRIVAPTGAGETTLVVNGKTEQDAAVVGPAARSVRSVAMPTSGPVVRVARTVSAAPVADETHRPRRRLRLPRWSRQWGVATVIDGTIVGVSGHHLSKRAARRRTEALRGVAEQQAGREVHFQVVRRNSPSSADWGVRPDVAATTPRAGSSRHESVVAAS